MVHQQMMRLLTSAPGPGIGQGWLLIAQAVHIRTYRSGGVVTFYHLIALVTVCVCVNMCTHVCPKVSFGGTVAMELGYECVSHYCAASGHLLCLLYAFAGPLFCSYCASSVLPHCCAINSHLAAVLSASLLCCQWPLLLCW